MRLHIRCVAVVIALAMLDDHSSAQISPQYGFGPTSTAPSVKVPIQPTEVDPQHLAAEQAYQNAEKALTERLLDREIAQNTDNATLAAAIRRELSSLKERLSSLKTNEEGKQLASTLNYISAEEIRRLMDDEIISLPRLAALESELKTQAEELKKLRNSPPPGFVPSASQETEGATILVALQQYQGIVHTKSKWLDDQVRAAPKTLDLAKAPTLEATLNMLRQKQDQLWKQAQDVGIARAEPQTTEKVTAAAEQIQLQTTVQKINQELREVQAQLETERLRNEMRLNQARSELQAQLDDANRKLAAAEAMHQIQSAQNDVTTIKGKEDAEMIRKRQACHEPDVARILAPFISKGYWEPIGGKGIESGPMSLTQIQSTGALSPDKNGIETLIKVADSLGNDRPRWGRVVPIGLLTPEQLEMVKKAQGYLNDLGEALVAEGMLSK